MSSTTTAFDTARPGKVSRPFDETDSQRNPSGGAARISNPATGLDPIELWETEEGESIQACQLPGLICDVGESRVHKSHGLPRLPEEFETWEGDEFEGGRALQLPGLLVAKETPSAVAHGASGIEPSPTANEAALYFGEIEDPTLTDPRDVLPLQLPGLLVAESTPAIAGMVDAATALKGLCVGCRQRLACTFAKPVGGVWHCDEYE